MVSMYVPVYLSTFGCFNSSLDIIAISFAVDKCPSAGSPLQFLNVVFFIPSSSHLLFIRTTKPSSLPPKYSASATAASLPEAIATPFNNSSTVLISPVSRSIVLPPIFLAFSLHVTLSSRLIFPLSTASIVKSIVIILVTEAGANFSSAFFSYITLPVVGSISKADLASILLLSVFDSSVFVFSSSLFASVSV